MSKTLSTIKPRVPRAENLAPKPGSAVWNVREVAKLTNTSDGVVREAIRAGTIPALRLGRRVVIPKAALSRLLGEE